MLNIVQVELTWGNNIVGRSKKDVILMYDVTRLGTVHGQKTIHVHVFGPKSVYGFKNIK